MGRRSNGEGAIGGEALGGLRGAAVLLAALSMSLAAATYADAQSEQPAAAAPVQAVPAPEPVSPPAAVPVTPPEAAPAAPPATPSASATEPDGARAPSALPTTAMPSSPKPSGTAPAAAAKSATGDPGKLRVALSPGAYGLAQKKVIFPAFDAQGATAVVEVPWPEGGPLRADAEGSWDVAEVDSADASTACGAGRLHKLDAGRLAKAADGGPAERDFLVGSLSDCGAGSTVWSSLIVFDRRAWRADARQPAAKGKRAKTPAQEPRLPETLADVLDAKTFPGMRALRKAPMHLLEMALLADGVPPEQIYSSLASSEGTARAFARLETLRGHIVWAETPAQTAKLLADRKAVMAAVYSGRAFQMAGVDGKPLGLIWDGQIYQINTWVIAKGTADADKATAFVALATDPTRQAAVAREFPYGPARASAVAQVGRHPILKVELAPYLPTAPASLRTALQLDVGFWRTHGSRLAERFEAWLKAPLSAPDPASGNASAEPAKPARSAPSDKAGKPI